MDLPLKKITIIGVGLIGGSFAKAAKSLKLADEVCGYGRNTEALQWGLENEVLDTFFTDIQPAVENADLVFLAVPLGLMEPLLAEMKPFISEHTIITDGGSAKTMMLQAARNVFGEIPRNFIAGHPIAGKEVSGITAACKDLYVDHRVILTPVAENNPAAVELVKTIWAKMGADVEIMDAQYHDEVFAATSHLPHLLAFNLVDLLNDHPELGNVFKYTAGGFRDFTRIASSDATMWRDISLYNNQAIVKWLREYQASVGKLAELVEAKEGEKLFQLFSEAKEARDTHIVNK